MRKPLLLISVLSTLALVAAPALTEKKNPDTGGKTKRDSSSAASTGPTSGGGQPVTSRGRYQLKLNDGRKLLVK